MVEREFDVSRANWRAEKEAAGLASGLLRALVKIPGTPTYVKAAALRELRLRHAAKGFPANDHAAS